MQQCYMIERKWHGVRMAAAIADIVVMPVDTTRRQVHVITRINVLPQYRGQGLGTELLSQILADADAEGIRLVLEPSASGGLEQEDLEKWYLRHGFSWGPWHMVRKPQ